MIDLTNDHVFAFGEALVSRGLYNRSAINGFGAVSFMHGGLLWQMYDIWLDQDRAQNLSTSWSNSDSVISTTWTDLQFGVSGEYLP